MDNLNFLPNTCSGGVEGHKLQPAFGDIKLWKMQAIAQELVRALFSDIESNSNSKTLSGRLFQRRVIEYECLQEIVQADSDQNANAVLAIHLYRIGTEKTLRDYVDVLKESGLSRPKGLGERIEAALVEALEPVDMEVN